MVRILAATLLTCAITAHAQQYDLVLHNGQVLDPKHNIAAKLPHHRLIKRKDPPRSITMLCAWLVIHWSEPQMK